MPIFKVWNNGRNVRKTIQANSLTELKEKAGKKFGLTGILRIVLETDGSEIEEDEVLLDSQGICREDVIFILLKENENWHPRQRNEKQPEMKSMSDTLYLKCLISQLSKELRIFMDPDFGLLEEMLRLKLLDDEGYMCARSKMNPYKKNDCILEYIRHKTRDEEVKDFMDALRNTEQSHVVNYILASGERLELNYGQERPLGVEEMSRLRANGPFLLANLIITEVLLAKIVSSKCIKQQHLEHINSQKTQLNKIVELLNILKRGSVAAFQKFIEALYDTRQDHVAEVLSKPGVAVPIHINITMQITTRDRKVIERELANRLNQLAETLLVKPPSKELHGKRRQHWTDIQSLWMELELSGIKFKTSKQGNSVEVYLWCQNSQSMCHLSEIKDSGTLERLFDRTLQHLANENEELSFSMRIIENEWRLAENYFQTLESQASFMKPSPFVNLPKELMEMVLIKSILSLYNATWRTFPFTDFDPYVAITSVCFDWWKLITNRSWFQNTVRSYLAQHKIVKKDSVLDVLPKELLEMILMRSLLSFTHILWKNSSSLIHNSFLPMSSVCLEWGRRIKERPWFYHTMKNHLEKNRHLKILQNHYPILDRCLEVDYHFLYEMHSRYLLSDEELLEIGRETKRLKQMQLLVKILLKLSAEKFAEFFTVLRLTSQGHIVNYFEADGAITDHDERPLNEEETTRLNFAKQQLHDFIPSTDILDNLVSMNCIVKRNADYISCLPDCMKSNELIDILQRRSLVALKQFVVCLRKLEQYASVAEMLTTADETAGRSELYQPPETDEEAGLDEGTLEDTLIEKLLDVARHFEDGQPVSTEDMNKLRIIWTLLQRFRPKSITCDDNEINSVDNVASNNAYGEFLEIDCMDNVEECASCGWTNEGNCQTTITEPFMKMTIEEPYVAYHIDLSDRSKPCKTSHQLNRSLFKFQDILDFFLVLHVNCKSSMQQQQDNKSSEGDAKDKVKEGATEQMPDNEPKFQLDDKSKEILQELIMQLQSCQVNSECHSNDNIHVIYHR